MATDLTLAMRLLLDSRQFVNGLGANTREVRKFTGTMSSEFGKLRNLYGSVQGRIAALGISVGGVATAVQSAKLDKSLSQIALTAGAGTTQVEALRNRLFALSKQSGTSVDDLLQGFNTLVQSGLSFDQALSTMTGINQAMAVTGANAQTLAQGITVASRAFQFDLSNPQMAVQLLEKMTVAGRLGNAELEDLSGVFGRVGTAAAKSGMQFEETLALIEGLSQSLPGQPERLATRAESTLRLFTNQNYLRTAQRATGVQFFDAAGARRDTTAVFSDLKKKFDAFSTDKARANWIQKGFGMTDLDTQTGLYEILSGTNLQQMKGFRSSIAAASGTFDKDMDKALSNAVDQTGRLTSTLRSAADGFAKPINEAVSRLIKYTLDSRQEGGLGLSGKDLLLGGGAALAGGYLAKRIGGRLLGGAGNVATGVAVGKALEATADVTPVFVTNWPQSLGGGAGDALAGLGVGAMAGKAASVFRGWRAGAALLAAAPSLSSIASFGAAGVAGAAGMVTGAGALGYGAGTLLNKTLIEGTDFGDKLGEAIARSLAAMGNDSARAAVDARSQFEGKLQIELTDTRTKVTQLSSNMPSLSLDVSNRGRMMGTP